MVSSLARLGRRLLVLWVEGVRRFAVWVLVAGLAATVGAAVFVVRNIAINTDTDDMLSPDLPFQKNSRELDREFPQFADTILVVIDGQTPDLADDAAMALGQRMRKEPKLFRSVYDLAGDTFFRRNGLLYLDTDELVALSDRLAEAQPFLGTLWHDPSLRGLFRMLGLAIDETLKEKGEVPPIEIGRVLNAISQTLEAQKDGRFSQLSWQQLMTEGADARGPYRRFILIQPVLDYGSLQPAADAIDAVRVLARDLGLTPGNGVRVRLTGNTAMAQDELKSVQDGMGLAAILSLVLVIGLLFIGFRSVRLSLATIATLVMGLIWTAGFAVFAIGKLNLISVAFAVLFIGLSVDFGIHFGLRYQESLRKGSAPGPALGEAAESVGGALTLCAVAAAIGFFSFLPTAYRGLAELGVIAGTGMFIALFSNLTVLPAFLAVMPVRAGVTGEGPGKFAVPIARWIRNHPRAVLSAALILAMMAAFFVPRARFDFDPINLRDARTESVATYLDLIKGDADGPYSVDVLAKSVEDAAVLAARLGGLPEVRETRTIADYVPTGQEDKLAVIQTMALFLAPALTPGDQAAPPTAAENRAAIAELHGRLRALAAATGDRKLQSDAERLDSAIEALGGGKATDAALADMQKRLLSALPRRLDYLRQSLAAEPVTLASLPEDLQAREIAKDGRTRIEVYPKENLTDRQALRRFVEAVRSVAPNATGGPIIILEAGDAVVEAFRDAGAIAIFCIAVLLFALLRNGRDVLFVFAPLVLATLLTVLASVLLRLPFNFANIIVLPLLFGLGVANGIHMVLRGRHEAAGREVFDTSTPRAVVFSALTTIGSFGSIALSSHPGTASMGVLLTIAITLTLVCTLVLLPALMAAWNPSGRTAIGTVETGRTGPTDG